MEFELVNDWAKLISWRQSLIVRGT